MLAYATLGTNDLHTAAKFYDEIFNHIGGSRMVENERSIAWSSEQGVGMGILTPFNGEKATVSNGGMLSLGCKSSKQVDALHALVLELGGSNEGDPGYRHEGVYMAYWRDLDGNKMSFLYMEATEGNKGEAL